MAAVHTVTVVLGDDGSSVAVDSRAVVACLVGKEVAVGVVGVTDSCSGVCCCFCLSCVVLWLLVVVLL